MLSFRGWQVGIGVHGVEILKIAVVGLGYVGTANAILLSQHYDVVAYDVCEEKVVALNSGKSPVRNDEINEYLSTTKLKLRATVSAEESLQGADYVFVAVPTDYDESHNGLDTSIVEQVVYDALKIDTSFTVVIKSTLPVGFTQKLRQKFNTQNIVYSPEFLREKTCLQDVFNPSRIVVGDMSVVGRKIADLLMSVIKDSTTPVILTNSDEAEAIKLFSNAYLALRVSFFNELDSFAMAKGLNTSEIIHGVCCDPRIGDYYNKPSTGYGGHCLPKDTKQLLASFSDIPQSIVSAIVDANNKRMEAVKSIIKRS